MRVTTNMIFENAQGRIAVARQRVQEASDQVSTGKRVVHPGDGAGAAGLMTVALERLEIIERASSRASSEAQLVDGTLQGVSSLLARARELTVQLGNDTYSTAERAGGAQEIRDISSQLVQLMNTSVAGRYVFGGNVDRTPPFDATGAYSGDTAVRQVEVAPGLLANASVRADQMMKGVGGGVDVFAALASLANSLSANDGAAVRASLSSIEAAGDQVATSLTQVGGFLNAFESSRTVGEVAQQSLREMLANETEIDPFEAISKLSQAQHGLEAALSVSAKSFSTSLLDFLR